MMRHSFLLSTAVCTLLCIHIMPEASATTKDAISKAEIAQKHPLPPYPTEKEIERGGSDFYRRNYDYMRNVFETINNKSYERIPSFDCKKAKTEVEKLICSDKELSELDAEMALLHKSFQGMYDFEWEPSWMHSKWLEARNTFNCTPKVKDKKECLASLYKEKIWGQKAEHFQILMRRNRSCFQNRRNEDPEINYLFYDLLFSQGVTVNDVSYQDGCPVFYVAESMELICFSYFLEKGANVNYSSEYCPPPPSFFRSATR